MPHGAQSLPVREGRSPSPRDGTKHRPRAATSRHHGHYRGHDVLDALQPLQDPRRKIAQRRRSAAKGDAPAPGLILPVLASEIPVALTLNETGNSAVLQVSQHLLRLGLADPLLVDAQPNPNDFLIASITERFATRSAPACSLDLYVADKDPGSHRDRTGLILHARHTDLALLGRNLATEALDTLDAAVLPSIRHHLAQATTRFFPIFDAACAYDEICRLIWHGDPDDEERVYEVRSELAHDLKCKDEDVPADRVATAVDQLPYKRAQVDPLFHPIDRRDEKPLPMCVLRDTHGRHPLVSGLLDQIDVAATLEARLRKSLDRRSNGFDDSAGPEWYMLWHNAPDGPGPICDLVADIFDEHMRSEQELGFASNWHAEIDPTSRRDVAAVWRMLDDLRALHDAVGRFFTLFSDYSPS